MPRTTAGCRGPARLGRRAPPPRPSPPVHPNPGHPPLLARCARSQKGIPRGVGRSTRRPKINAPSLRSLRFAALSAGRLRPSGQGGAVVAPRAPVRPFPTPPCHHHGAFGVHRGPRARHFGAGITARATGARLSGADPRHSACTRAGLAKLAGAAARLAPLVLGAGRRPTRYALLRTGATAISGSRSPRTEMSSSSFGQ